MTEIKINRDQYEALIIVHGIYQIQVNDHLIECRCKNCIIRNSLSELISENKWKYNYA